MEHRLLLLLLSKFSAKLVCLSSMYKTKQSQRNVWGHQEQEFVVVSTPCTRSLSLSNCFYVWEINSSDLCHFSISAHTTLQDYSRLTHIPHLHTPYFTLRRGLGASSLCCEAQFSCRAGSVFSEIAPDDGVNKGDRLILQRWAAEPYSTEASKSSCSLQPVYTGREGLRGGGGEAAGNVGTHTVFTIGKRTLGQNRYHILLSYRAASVSWSCWTPLSLVVEAAGWLVEPASYSYGNGSSFPSGSQGKRGPLVPIASLQLL